jgi:hypothetical protein
MEGIAINPKEPMELCEAIEDSLGNDLVQLPAKQPRPIVDQVPGIIDLPGPVRGVNQLPGISCGWRLRTKAPKTVAKVVRAGDHRRGSSVQLLKSPERVFNDVDAAIGPAGEDCGTCHRLRKSDVELVGEESAGGKTGNRHRIGVEPQIHRQLP